MHPTFDRNSNWAIFKIIKGILKLRFNIPVMILKRTNENIKAIS